MEFLEASDKILREVIPPRRKTSHKGDNGRILVVGGSHLYHGAPVFSALSAYRCGVDLVYVAVPKPLVTPVRAYSPSLIVMPLPDLRLTEGCVNKIVKNLERGRINVDSAAVGSGMGKTGAKEVGLLTYKFSRMDVGVVLDGGALQSGILDKVKGANLVLTPHEGEFHRVFGIRPGTTLKERIAVVKETAGNFQVTVLLKGIIDIISNGEAVAINRLGNPGMTVGGTGDVLCGVVAALLARGVKPFKSALAAAYINSAAGERALRRWGLHFTAEDLLVEIPRVMSRFDRIV
ncbi:MAG: NAD(P)H-hydrate dehydratase [Nitrososphaeria archaeon]|nr:NAD(P)H-hydrate dehydratase [Nitrososphaeria archaeon]NIN53048.1 NAD(P)H-hydrate dehydratase [Nitrososphaeria archaeon]